MSDDGRCSDSMVGAQSKLLVVGSRANIEPEDVGARSNVDYIGSHAIVFVFGVEHDVIFSNAKMRISDGYFRSMSLMC